MILGNQSPAPQFLNAEDIERHIGDTSTEEHMVCTMNGDRFQLLIYFGTLEPAPVFSATDENPPARPSRLGAKKYKLYQKNIIGPVDSPNVSGTHLREDFTISLTRSLILALDALQGVNPSERVGNRANRKAVYVLRKPFYSSRRQRG